MGAHGPRTLAGLPTFWPITFHLLFSYSLIAFNRAWLWIRKSVDCRNSNTTGTASPHPQQTQRNACPKDGQHAMIHDDASAAGLRTLYQCFFTEPSVLVGKVCSTLVARSHVLFIKTHTLAISAQLFPASRICLRRNSSCGVHGVLVRLFFAGGCDAGSGIDIFRRSLGLGRRSRLRGRGRGDGRLNLARSDRRRRSSGSRGRSRVGGRTFPLTTRLRRSLGRGLLLGAAWCIGRLLRHVHGRLDGCRVMLLRHVGLRSAIGKVHPLVATSHVGGLVRVVAVWVPRSAVSLFTLRGGAVMASDCTGL